MGGGLRCHKGKQVGRQRAGEGRARDKNLGVATVGRDGRRLQIEDSWRDAAVAAGHRKKEKKKRKERRGNDGEAATLENDSGLKGFSAQREAAAENVGQEGRRWRCS